MTVHEYYTCFNFEDCCYILLKLRCYPFSGSYTPGTWIEQVGGMKLADYDIPQTSTLILIGPKGSGKSSLINRISKVFEEDHFAPERAQVSCISLNSF